MLETRIDENDVIYYSSFYDLYTCEFKEIYRFFASDAFYRSILLKKKYSYFLYDKVSSSLLAN